MKFLLGQTDQWMDVTHGSKKYPLLFSPFELGQVFYEKDTSNFVIV